jgi:hypothetical protein
MEQKTLRREINRVLLIIGATAGLVVVVVLFMAHLGAADIAREEQQRQALETNNAIQQAESERMYGPGAWSDRPKR